MAREIEVSLKDSGVGTLLDELKAKIGNLRPVLKTLGEIVVTSVQQNFEIGGLYSQPGSWKGGTRSWQDLAESTKKARAKRGHWPGKILIESGRLAASITAKVIGDAVHVGTNVVYAAIHNFGGVISVKEREGVVAHRLTRSGKELKQKGHPNLSVFGSYRKHKNLAFKQVTFGAYQIKIPARPFLVVQEDDLDGMRATILDWVIPKK